MAEAPAPLFSIITPVLNGAAHLRRYVQALQQQHCRDWEAIVIDDGSSDGSPALLLQLVAGDSRFRLAHTTASKDIPGPYLARNRGLELACGPWVCFLDVDDLWLPHKLAHQARLLQQRPQLALLYGTHWRARSGSRWARLRRHPPLLPPVLWLRAANPVPMLTACVRRELATAVAFRPLHHEDYVYWQELVAMLSPGQIHADAEPLALYTVAGDSLSANKWQATGWIWRCYRHRGDTRPAAAAALLLRGLLQLWYLLSSPVQRLPDALQP